VNTAHLTPERLVRVTRGAHRALQELLPIGAGDTAFAGVLLDLGQAADLTLAIEQNNDTPQRLFAIAYALLMRACAGADEAGDDALANACGEALEALDDVAIAIAARQ